VLKVWHAATVTPVLVEAANLTTFYRLAQKWREGGIFSTGLCMYLISASKYSCLSRIKVDSVKHDSSFKQYQCNMFQPHKPSSGWQEWR